MDYVILGGAGFIGRHLAHKLLADEHNTVLVIDSLQTSTHNEEEFSRYQKRYVFVHANLTTAPDDALIHICSKADVIFHLAGSVGVEHIDKDPSGTLFNNIDLNYKLCRVFRAAGKHVVFSSTSEIYGEGPFSEDSNASIGPSSKLRWGYAAAKLMMEFMLRASGIPVTIVRFFNVVGPGQLGDYGMVLPRFIKAALEGKDLIVYGTGEQVRSFCHIDDAIDALVRVADIPGETFNIGNVEPVTIRELAQRVVDITESTSNIVLVPYADAFSEHHGDIIRRIPVLTKIKSMTGYEPRRNLDVIIRDMVKSVVEQAAE